MLSIPYVLLRISEGDLQYVLVQPLGQMIVSLLSLTVHIDSLSHARTTGHSAYSSICSHIRVHTRKDTTGELTVGLGRHPQIRGSIATYNEAETCNYHGRGFSYEM